MVIGSASFFQVCPDCGQHGRIVLATGEASPEVFCKAEALKFMEAAVKNRLITEAELPELGRQIRLSHLPPTFKEANPLMQLWSDLQSVFFSDDDEEDSEETCLEFPGLNFRTIH